MLIRREYSEEYWFYWPWLYSQFWHPEPMKWLALHHVTGPGPMKKVPVGRRGFFANAFLEGVRLLGLCKLQAQFILYYLFKAKFSMVSLWRLFLFFHILDAKPGLEARPDDTPFQASPLIF